MDLFAGKTLMDMGVNAEMLQELSGDILPEGYNERLKIARRNMLRDIADDPEEDGNRRARARRGFASRKEERDAKKGVTAQIRRYHRMVDGQMFNRIADRRAKKKRANTARRITRVCN